MFLSDLISLECLNLDSCKIGDEGLFHLKGLMQLKVLELSDTEVGSNGLRHLSGLTGLTHLDLFGALIVDSGMNCFRCSPLAMSRSSGMVVWNWRTAGKRSEAWSGGA
ncbi:uncharacterized protein [Miscanthus floridulus]|uniref:uncharacterized protein n=1 Tax=Miscanthus floridulus TaxID=154761 RepID=UPI003459381A